MKDSAEKIEMCSVSRFMFLSLIRVRPVVCFSGTDPLTNYLAVGFICEVSIELSPLPFVSVGKLKAFCFRRSRMFFQWMRKKMSAVGFLAGG